MAEYTLAAGMGSLPLKRSRSTWATMTASTGRMTARYPVQDRPAMASMIPDTSAGTRYALGWAASLALSVWPRALSALIMNSTAMAAKSSVNDMPEPLENTVCWTATGHRAMKSMASMPPAVLPVSSFPMK